MSLPMQRLPGASYGVVVRCERRLFRLVPRRELRSRAGYVLAKYCREHGIRLHSHCFMSNHLHLVLTDVRGVLGAFMQDLDAALARIVNAQQGERGRVFDRYESWRLLGPDAILAHMVYVTLNPVRAVLVPRPEAWPGLVALPLHVERPEGFEEPPEGISGRASPDRELGYERLRLSPPPGLSREDFVQRFAALLSAELVEAQALHPRKTTYPSRQSLREAPHTHAPSTPPGSGRPPEIAASEEEDRDALREFHRVYRPALQSWREGKRTEAVFPPGTFKMVRLHAARVAPP